MYLTNRVAAQAKGIDPDTLQPDYHWRVVWP